MCSNSEREFGSPPRCGIRVLIIGFDYWPDVTGIAPYTTMLAEHLQSLGNAVTVKTGFPYYPQWSVAEGYQGRFRRKDSRNGVVIHRYRQYIPGRQTALRRIAMEGTFLLNGLFSWDRSRYDVVVGVTPPLADGMLALAYASRRSIPLVLIVQDLVGSAAAQSGMAGGARIAVATGRAEAWILRRAERIGVVAEGFVDRLVSVGVSENRIYLTRNWTHISPPSISRDDLRTRLGLPLDRFIALHAGNMGLKQGLHHVIEAARVARDNGSSILFVLMGDGNQRADLQRLALGMDNVRFIPPQDDAIFPSMLAASDALLINQLPSVTDMSLPSKLTSYFSSGRPVVAAVSSASEAAKVIVESGGGIVVDPTSSQELVATLNMLGSQPSLGNEIGALGKNFAAVHLSSEAGLERLEELIYGAHAQAATTMKGLPAV